MKKIFFMLCVGSLSFAACTQEKSTADIDSTTATTPAETVEADGTDYDNDYRDRASRMSSEMAADMHFDTTTQAGVEQAYLKRQRRQDEVRKKYNFEAEGNVSSGGATTETEGNTDKLNPDMITELETIDVETDNEFRSLLKPDQYKIYEANRARYWNDDSIPEKDKRQITRDGDEVKVKAGDIKVSAEPGKSKVETPTYESKIDGKERSYKSKVDDTKVKYKVEDGKIK